MSKASCEKRREVRVLFSRQERVICHLSYPGNPESHLEAMVLNMSRNGIGLALKRSHGLRIQKGMLLNLKRIQIAADSTNRELSFHEDIQMQIQWIMDDTVMNQIGIGCRYINCLTPIYQKICRFVNSSFSGRMELIQAE